MSGEQAHQHADGGRFSRAVRSEEAEEASARNRQGQTVYRGLLAVRLPKIANGNSRPNRPVMTLPMVQA